MRRPLSLITTAVLAATSLVGLSQTAVSANSINDTTITRTTTVGPAAVPNAAIDRVLPIPSSGKFLVAGRDSTDQFARVHLWRMNADLTIDNTFTARDLGADFAYPDASIASTFCNGQVRSECFRIESFAINEATDTFIASVSRQLKSPVNQNFSMVVYTIVTGKLSTGEVVTNNRYLSTYSGVQLSDWTSLNAGNLGQDACTAGTGTAVGGISFDRSNINFSNPTMRSDGAIVVSVRCEYSNFVFAQSTSVTEYLTHILIALKPSGATLTMDTAFGTNGTTVLFNDQTKCLDGAAGITGNAGLPLTNTTDALTVFSLDIKGRDTTVPSYMSTNGITSYNGCHDTFSQSSDTSKLLAVNVLGQVTHNQSFPSGLVYRTVRWVIDPQGRWNTVLTPRNPNPAQNSTNNTVFLRLDRTGKFDTTLGTNGIKDIQSMLVSSVTVNGTSVRVNYSITGFVTTATGIMFTGFANVFDVQSWACITGGMGQNGYTTTVTRTYFPYYLTPDEGLVTSFGTGGLGEAVPIIYPQGSSCNSAFATFITAQGQHALFASTVQSGSQPAGIMYARFGAAQGVTGGGDGGGEVTVASAGRTDTKVYSRKLPTSTEVNTSLNVLTKKMSRTQMLRTRTPKVCVNLTQSVVLVKTGTCRLEVVDKASRQVVRRLSTRVRETTSEVGTTVNTENSIRFSLVSRRLSNSAKAQIAELAESAATAKRVILVGHSAGLTENTVSNNRIALQRAAAVKAELQKQFKAAGVKVPISIVSVGPNAPITTKRTETAQSRNRRVEVFVMP